MSAEGSVLALCQAKASQAKASMGWQLAPISLTHISLSQIHIRGYFQFSKPLGYIYAAAFCLLNVFIWRKSCFLNAP